LGVADSLFLKGNVIAIGWHELGDVTSIGGDREALKAKIAETYPKAKAGAIPVHGGLIYRFINEMQPGDLVIYPSKIDRHIHIGRVGGDFRHDPALSREYPNGGIRGTHTLFRLRNPTSRTPRMQAALGTISAVR